MGRWGPVIAIRSCLLWRFSASAGCYSRADRPIMRSCRYYFISLESEALIGPQSGFLGPSKILNLRGGAALVADVKIPGSNFQLSFCFSEMRP
jgi:hypothetical protein